MAALPAHQYECAWPSLRRVLWAAAFDGPACASASGTRNGRVATIASRKTADIRRRPMR